MMQKVRTDRVEALRMQSETTVPHLSMERAVLMTEAYQKYGGRVSVPMMRALSFEHLMTNQSICINEHELIVGERGPVTTVGAYLSRTVLSYAGRYAGDE
jgi:trans-4-hydroxy-L-proline dehydratase